jgi:hypothetical protein
MDECPVDRDRCGIGRIPRKEGGRRKMAETGIDLTKIWNINKISV